MRLTKFQLCVQDPFYAGTTYLYEIIIGQLQSKTLLEWQGIFAFASAGAIKSLFEEEPTRRFLTRGKISLLIGVDDVTDDITLQTLSDLMKAYPNLNARIFYKDMQGIFHPKLSIFKHIANKTVIVIGSGNLTPGGLRHNVETFCLVEVRGKPEDICKELLGFIDRNSGSIKDIDADMQQLAAKNRTSVAARRERDPYWRMVTRETKPEPPFISGRERVLIAEVPAAGERWHQIHYNRETIEEFFRVKPRTNQRVFLRAVSLSGEWKEEEIRPLVYSYANRNYRIEARFRADEEYPKEGPPIIILKEIGIRNFLYTILMPKDEPYKTVREFLHGRTRVGRGRARTICFYEELKNIWPQCPL